MGTDSGWREDDPVSVLGSEEAAAAALTRIKRWRLMARRTSEAMQIVRKRKPGGSKHSGGGGEGERKYQR